MLDEYAKRAEFGPSLAAEVNRILEDPIFHRSPVLSKLLKYLRDQTVDPHHAPITQFSIAVEGLGRRQDYDQDGESYARVQISRLRKSLAEYYTRNQPGGQVCVYLPHGNYTLRLAPVERAYPELRRPAVATAEITTAPGPNTVAPASFSRHSATLITVVTVATVLFIWGTLTFAPKLFHKDSAIVGPPGVAAQIDGDDLGTEMGTEARRRNLAAAEIRKALTSSAVIVQSDASDAAYRVQVDLGSGSQLNPQAVIRLTNSHNSTIFAQTLPMSADEGLFIRSIDAALADIFSTSGALAKDLTNKFDIHKPRSDFECFLSVEAERSSGQLIKNTLDHCISTFPNSPYAPYWYARQSFAEYQIGIFRGQPVRKNSGGWESLVRALARDRFNSFVNGLAAKVELAEGNCEQPRVYLSRSLARSLTSPSMKAALLVDTLPCAKNASERLRLEQAFNDLLATEPDADPVLRLYITLGALELGKADLARSILSNGISQPEAEGSVAKTLKSIEFALNPANVNRVDNKQLATWIACFAWNPEARKRIISTIENSSRKRPRSN